MHPLVSGWWYQAGLFVAMNTEKTGQAEGRNV
jgi:hypothetical protein